MKPENITANVPADFIPQVSEPQIDPTAYVHPLAAVIGAVTLGRHVFVAPQASIRADEGFPFYIGDESNVQDGVVLHGLETYENGQVKEANLRLVNGCKYSIYIGRGVSLAHQCHLHGPAVVMDDCFVGMQALIFRSTVARGCVIEPAAKVMGVNIPTGRYVKTGSVIHSQSQADALPEITFDYPYRSLNQSVVGVNVQLARGYRLADKNNSS